MVSMADWLDMLNPLGQVEDDLALRKVCLDFKHSSNCSKSTLLYIVDFYYNLLIFKF